MLELRPVCENCACELAPDNVEARICSYECTFCRSCVEAVLMNVCPNCGGGFEQRPVRPMTARRDGVSLQYQPATLERKHKPVNAQAHRQFAADVCSVAPQGR